MHRVFIVISIVAACDFYRICSGVVKSDKLPDPDVLAEEIDDDFEAALEQFREIAADLTSKGDESQSDAVRAVKGAGVFSEAIKISWNAF